MMSFCDQMERALDSLDGVLHKMLRTVTWLLDTKDCDDHTMPSDLPDIIKDLNRKPAMTLQDFLPDIITSSNQDRLGGDLCQRRKSLNDISKSRVNNNNNKHINNREENVLRRSLRNLEGIPHCQRQVSHPCETDTDIELQIDLNKPTTSHHLCRRVCSDPLPLSSLAIDHDLGQDIDGTDGPNSIQNESPVTTENTDGAAGDDSNSEGERENQLVREEAKNKLQRRVAELFNKHFPEMPVDHALAKEPDETLCHDIVSELKDIADSFDQRHKGKNPLQAIQETLNLNLPQFLLPHWLQHGVGPAVADATLKAALQYSRL